MSARAKAVVTAVFGSAIVIMVVLPLSLLTLPNPGPVRVVRLPTRLSGTFVSTEHGLFRLYPYATPAGRFPSDALPVDGRISVLIRYRQLDALRTYSICRYRDGKKVAVRKVPRPGRVLEVTPVEALPPGTYYITAARDGIYGGADYFYFSVASCDTGRIGLDTGAHR